MLTRRPRSHHYNVYVELSDAVWNVARFREANPGYVLGKPFVYVGMTGLDPDTRFDRHMAGVQSNRFVREFGLRLVPKLYCVQACQTPKPCSRRPMASSTSMSRAPS